MNTPDRQIFIGNLFYGATESDVAEAAARRGIKLARVRVITDKETQRSRGFAFADLADDEPRPVAAVIALLNGYSFHDRPCRVCAVNANIVPRRAAQGDRGHQNRRPRREAEES